MAGSTVIRRETERDYLDAAIGKAVLGEPKRTLIETAQVLGDITRGGVWMAERRILIKLGRAVREMPYARFDEVPK